MKKNLSVIISAVLAVGSIIPMNVHAYDYRCMGDSNGDNIVDGKDASNVLTMYSKMSVGNYSISSDLKQKCDVNCDNIIDGKDASEILSYYSCTSVGQNTVPDTYYMKNMLKNSNFQALLQAAENLYDMTCRKALSYETGSIFKTDYKDTLKSGNSTYLRVTDPKIKTMEDVYNDYHSLFATDAYLSDGTNGKYLCYVSAPDGSVYALGGGRGGNIAYQYSKITAIKSITANSVTFNVLSHYDNTGLPGINTPQIIDRNENFTFEMQNDGTLKVTEFTLPY